MSTKHSGAGSSNVSTELPFQRQAKYVASEHPFIGIVAVQ